MKPNLRTNKLSLVYSFMIIGLLFLSCTTNEQPEGKIDDEPTQQTAKDSVKPIDSIKYKYIIGKYKVKDSVLTPFLDYYKNSYVLEISKNPSNPKKLIVKNINNKNLEYSATFSNDICTIPSQPLSSKKYGNITPHIEGKIKLISNDSIHLEYYFMNELSDPFFGKGTGVKIKKSE